MPDKKPEPTQNTEPRGIDPATGKPYKAIEIPVPKRKDFDKLLERATKKPRRSSHTKHGPEIQHDLYRCKDGWVRLYVINRRHWPAFVEWMGKTDDTADSLLQKARQFETERRKLLTQTKQLTHKLREALENEYREIVVGERHFTPSDAARFVSAKREPHSWIPAPIKLGADLSLAEQELVRLYALGASYGAEEEQDARHPLPELATLPSERQFQVMVSEYQHLTTTDLTPGADRWQPTDNDSDRRRESDLSS